VTKGDSEHPHEGTTGARQRARKSHMRDLLCRAAGPLAVVVVVPFTYLAAVADDRLGCDLLSEDDE